MNDNINGYILDGDFRIDNSGSSRWGFARKDGQEVFIKEFLSPTYPIDKDMFSPKVLNERIKWCEDFFNSKKRLYDALNKCNTGNVVGILDFFNYGAKYYIVTEKINNSQLSIEEISAMPLEQKKLICKIIVYCLMALHNHHIVHCDIKHENILFKKTATGKYVAKLIDFDASFLENEPPSSDDEFQGDMVYYAPESVLFMLDKVKSVNSKIDIFALGLLFHQYFTGHLPYFNQDEYDYAYEYILDGNVVKSDESIPEKYAQIINSMLLIDPECRPSAQELFQWLDETLCKDVEKDKPLDSGFFYAGDL